MNSITHENSFGKLKISVTSSITAKPIDSAEIQISSTGEPNHIIEKIKTNSSGFTEELSLPAPPVEYSLEKTSFKQPYSEYNISIKAPGYQAVTISGCEILANTLSIQPITLDPDLSPDAADIFAIPAHTLYAQYPPKIPEEDIKPVTESGEIVLSKVVIPEYIIVHDGSPRDSTAKNYYVRYKDYIKNVASSEIYATWPDSTIRANVLAIMSFTLNRVYTEWYRNKGYDYTITSSTAFDHKWIPKRNIFESISKVVDEIFACYLSRPNVRQPILTQYCDGRKVQCPNWMTQWGSKALGDQGYTAIEILRYYYGESIYINTAEEISGIPSSWPGYDLSVGSSGKKVRQIQEELNRISEAYPAIPSVAIDGIFGRGTEKSVKEFQSVFGLPVSGIVDYPTWYKISEIYVGVSRIAKLS